MSVIIEKAKNIDNYYWVNTRDPFHLEGLWSATELLELHEWTTRHLQELKQEVTIAQDNASLLDDPSVS